MRASQVMKIIYAVAAGLLPLSLSAFYLSSGPDAGYTAAPGDSQFACASAGCHTRFGTQGGPINFHGGSITATFSNGSSYIPGSPVTITVRVSDPASSRFGFQMTARRASSLSSGQAGRFDYTGTSIFVLCQDNNVRSRTGNCSAGAPIEFIEHQQPSQTGTWTFTWTPPADIGPVHFYMAGNAANGNFSADDGDHIYTNAYVLTPAGACVSSAPQISGVISAGAFGARPDFSPGTWLEVYGSNLSSVTKEWAGADFNGLSAPQVLDRVRVKVNGKDAFTRYVSPGQVNVLAPTNAGTGPMNVTVSNCEQTSAPVSLQQVNAAPGMLTGTPAGKLIAFAPDNTLRAAKPGEMIVAYGIGFGATNPAIEPGQIAGAISGELPRLAETLTVTIGGVQLTPAQVVYAGLAPGYVGLYQFNLVVPDVPDGDRPVTMRIGNANVNQSLFLTVQR